jgi:hypothetical protein
MIQKLRHTAHVTRLMFALVFVLGCGSSAKPAVEAPPPPPPPQVAGDPSCPLLVPGTSITAEDSAWVFVTTGDVARVRARGTALAAMHNDRKGDPGSMGLALSAKATAVATEIEGGVRVTFQPEDPATAGALGDELKMHASHLAGAASCKMGH